MTTSLLSQSHSECQLVFKGSCHRPGLKRAPRGAVVRAALDVQHAERNFDWKKVGAVAVLSASLCLTDPAWADLNKYEAAAGGEFNIGTAQQYGEADIKGKDFHDQDLRRSNFTAADCRDCNFKNSKLQGTYFIKTVVARANFENADLSDVLMDRAVLNDSNLTNANLSRAILTRSDLGGAKISGTDFSNALLDKTQQIALCRYADGTNSVTGVETRKSLGCGSRRRFKEASPSSPEGPQVDESEKDAFRKTMPIYRQ
ncbi:g12933 [Coccomyxa viridis]|uniref:G12933 protein n=1 Tax=Coccomyxa viridis TaxID=1274662 RepID=A0ABP1GE78_9CHLO